MLTFEDKKNEFERVEYIANSIRDEAFSALLEIVKREIAEEMAYWENWKQDRERRTAGVLIEAKEPDTVAAHGENSGHTISGVELRARSPEGLSAGRHGHTTHPMERPRRKTRPV